MFVLCLDTATPDVAAALVDTATGEAWPRAVRDARGAGEHLMPLATAAVADAGRTLADVAAVAVGLGPGPYTGLRVGVVTAATLAHALGVPAHGCCSLDAWAVGASTVVTDARRREVFWARYDDAGIRTDGPFVTAPADVPRDLPLVGPGSALLPTGDERVLPVARLAALVGLGSPAVPLVPLYLRKPDAAEPAR